MKKVKFTKENIALMLITVLSAILNFGNLSIEGTANAYYAAAAKSMTMSFKNFFFVSFDPAGFVTIDKPPLGFWLQAISAKIFGYSGWSILLPQALAGVISVVVLYFIVKRSFGSAAGLIASLCLAVTPVFVAVSRNNSVDNILVMVLLFACWALSVAAEKGKLKYLILSLALVGVGFNVKMLQAYMVAPALYITYLLATSVSLKKRIIHLAAGTAVLIAVSLSWALIVDSIPASSRPYVDSSTNNTVMELIIGHNGLERLSLSNNSNNGGGGGQGGQRKMGNPPSGMPGGQNSNSNSSNNRVQNQNTNNSNNVANGTQGQDNQGFPGNPPSGDGNGMGNPPSGYGQMGHGGPNGNMQGGPGGGSSSGLQGTFGAQAKSSITRLFSKNILSDQIVWFIPLAIIGFIAAAIKEKLNYKLDNKKKQSLMLWFMWFLPVFLYFSYNTGTFHSYYLTMLAPAAAALTGIGITSMWELYKEGGKKAWFLPAALLANGAVQLLMQYYFASTSSIIKLLMVLLIVLCFGSSIVLGLFNIKRKKSTDEGKELDKESDNKLKKLLVSLAVVGLLITPLVGSSTVLFTKLNGSFPAAGLELLSSIGTQDTQQMGMGGNGPSDMGGSSNSKLIEYLQENKTSSQKYLLVVSNANEASEIIVQTGEPVMAIGGFLGNDKSITLDQFKELVKKGEVRYVMTGGMRGGSGVSSEIMTWVQQVGTLVSSNEYGVTNTATAQTNNNTAASNAQANNNAASSSTKTDNNANSETANTNNSNSSQGKQGRDGFGGGNSGQLYDLKAYTDSLSK